MAGVAWRVATSASVAQLIAATATSRVWNENPGRLFGAVPGGGSAIEDGPAGRVNCTLELVDVVYQTRGILPTEHAGAVTKDSAGTRRTGAVRRRARR